ncbi:hypothetical protein Tco_1576489 [Tanacetum coccineum]
MPLLNRFGKALVQDGDAADSMQCARFSSFSKTIPSLSLLLSESLDTLKEEPALGLWYSTKESSMELVAYTDRLPTSTTEAEYVAAASCCGQSHLRSALTKKPDVYISFIKQFWRYAEASNDDNREVLITATIDGHSKTITEASLRRHLKGRKTTSTTPQEHFPVPSLSIKVFKQYLKRPTRAEQHFPTPNESPLHAVHSYGSAEGSLKLNELTTLVTKLSEKIGILEDDLKKTKLTYSVAVTKLILRDDEDVEDGFFQKGTEINLILRFERKQKHAENGKTYYSRSGLQLKSFKISWKAVKKGNISELVLLRATKVIRYHASKDENPKIVAKQGGICVQYLRTGKLHGISDFKRECLFNEIRPIFESGKKEVSTESGQKIRNLLPREKALRSTVKRQKYELDDERKISKDYFRHSSKRRLVAEDVGISNLQSITLWIGRTYTLFKKLMYYKIIREMEAQRNLHDFEVSCF